MTYRVDVPNAAEGDVITVVVRGTMVLVQRNGRALPRHEYRLSCDHTAETAGCPACLERGEHVAERDATDDLSRSVGMRPRGTWGADDAPKP